jgi:hypothetical protein
MNTPNIDKVFEIADAHYGIDDRIRPDDPILLGVRELKRMSAIVEAAVEWRKHQGITELFKDGCGCVFCNLIRACDEYLEKEE